MAKVVENVVISESDPASEDIFEAVVGVGIWV
jgi:hypothetical protein